MVSSRCILFLVVASCSQEQSLAFSSVRHKQMPVLRRLSTRKMASKDPTSSGSSKLEADQKLNTIKNGPTVGDEFVRSEFESSASGTVVPKPQAIVEEAGQEDSGKIDIGTARLLLFAIAIIWGTNFASVKYLETLCFNPPCVHPPSEAALARFGLASAVSFPLLVGQRKDIILAGLECGGKTIYATEL
jgi:hypothetical protein